MVVHLELATVSHTSRSRPAGRETGVIEDTESGRSFSRSQPAEGSCPADQAIAAVTSRRRRADLDRGVVRSVLQPLGPLAVNVVAHRRVGLESRRYSSGDMACTNIRRQSASSSSSAVTAPAEFPAQQRQKGDLVAGGQGVVVGVCSGGVQSLEVVPGLGDQSCACETPSTQVKPHAGTRRLQRSK